MGINITRFLEDSLMWLLFLTLIALVLVLVACVTGKWILLGVIPILFLVWAIWKFALWAAGQVPTWQGRIQNWWTTTVVPWWADNTARVIRAAVLAIIATAIAVVVCVTVKFGPTLSSSGSICPACKGTPTAVAPSAKVVSSCAAMDENFTRVATIDRPVRLEQLSRCPLTRTVWGPVGYASYSVRFPTEHGDSTVVFLKDGPHKELPFPLDWMEFAPVGVDSVAMMIRQHHP